MMSTNYVYKILSKGEKTCLKESFKLMGNVLENKSKNLGDKFKRKQEIKACFPDTDQIYIKNSHRLNIALSSNHRIDGIKECRNESCEQCEYCENEMYKLFEEESELLSIKVVCTRRMNNSGKNYRMCVIAI